MTGPISIWDRSTGLVRDSVAGEATPGCGAVAATTAVLGLALVLKGLNISESKAPDGVRAKRITQAQQLLQTLSRQADRDGEAFAAYLEATRRARDSGQDGARELREAAARLNLIPLEIAVTCNEALALTVASTDFCTANLQGDLLGGGTLLHAALSAALLTADADLAALDDPAEQHRAREHCRALQQGADQRLQELREQAQLAAP